MQRIVVGLRKSNGKCKVPKFSECLVEYFVKNSNSAIVSLSLENEYLVLDKCSEGYELMHSPECPIKVQSSSGTSELTVDNSSKYHPKNDNIGVATSVVIESSDSHVLLTKRSTQMRASPNVWVTPGGHIELGETIFEAGVREVKEETGLDIGSEKASVLGLWENVYPLILGFGIPKYHVLVVYLHICLKETHDLLTPRIIPNSDEVDSYCWLESSTLQKLFCNEKINYSGKQYINKEERLVEMSLDYNQMFNKWLWSQSESYTGVNYALRKWLQYKKSTNNVPFSCKF